jgi:hypothetical protein
MGESGQPQAASDDSACIRRWYAVISACTCGTCTTDSRRYRKLQHAGAVTRVTSDEAWRILTTLTRDGWSAAAIASAAGLPDECVEHVLATPGRRIGATIAAAIADHGQPTRGHVGAIPARRKLQALAALGHPPARVAEAASLGVSTIHAVARATTVRITPRVNTRVDEAYRALSMEPGTHSVVRSRAIARGWAPPLAWDDIDDVGAVPLGLPDPWVVPRGIDIGEVEFLTRTGAVMETAARRLGKTTEALERACHRAGRHDLVAALKATRGAA